MLVLGAGGLLFTPYFSYTPLHTISTIQMNNNVSSIAWSPDSQDFAAVTFGQNYGTGRVTMNLWRTRTAQNLLTYTFPSPPYGFSQLAWAPNGRSFAIAWNDGNVEIWEAKASSDSSGWSQTASFRTGGHEDFRSTYLTDLAWSATSNRLLVSYSDGSLSGWDALAGHVQSPILAPQVAGAKSSIFALSPHGTQAILSSQQVGSNSKTYTLWDIATGRKSPLIVMQADSLQSVAWSPDEHAVAVGDGTKVMIWQWNEQENIWLLVHSMTVSTPHIGASKMAWSPDGKRLAIADTGNVIRLWSVESEKLLGPQFPLFDHPISKNEEYADVDNAITTLAWSPNGKYLLSGNSAGLVMLQDVL